MILGRKWELNLELRAKMFVAGPGLKGTILHPALKKNDRRGKALPKTEVTKQTFTFN